jgi:hypothetical protein
MVLASPAVRYTANERPARIQNKCVVQIYVFPETKLRSHVISKTELECYVSQFPHSCILLQPNRQTDPGNI